MERIDLEHCYKVATQIVAKASEIVLTGWGHPKKIDTKSAYWDMVTECDKATEKYLIESLKEAFPTHKFIGEESSEKPKITDEPTWIIDPIDGTTNFVHGHHYCAISVGFVVNKEVVLGIVASPPLKLTFSAIKGKGAFLNGERIHTSNVTELKSAVVAQEISIAAIPSLTDLFINRYKVCTTKAQGMRSFGSAAMSLCEVARGTIDAYQVEYLYPWDLAGGSIIITEAGGTVLDMDGGKFDVAKGRCIAAGTSKLAKTLVELFK